MDKDIVCVSGIYAITNTVNGKKYIGSAVNLHVRWGKHKSCLFLGTHHNKRLQSSWVKYGSAAFEFSVIEYVEDKTMLIPAEQRHIDAEDAGGIYNFCKVAGSILGVKRSPETLEKMRKSGLKYRPSQETVEKLRIASTGKKASPEKLAKMSALVKSQETIEKLRIAGTGRKLSEESIQKMRAFNLGIKKSGAAKEKMRQAKLGTKQSSETIEKRMAGLRGRKHSPEEIAKRVASRRLNQARRMTP